ncbi:HEAT repeat-containing protein 1-like, partial [Lingula anatina]|uniref:HEAT repeat-containing protein 1 n=1 Tax=Lingula anatina TaxID=7574 RepID=A0A1S3H148_LINAN
ILWQIIPPTELFEILQKVLQKGYVKSKWRPTLKTTLELICSMSTKGDHSKDTSLTMVLLPHMLVTQAEEEAIELARTVLESSYASQHTLFKDLKKVWCKKAPGINVTLEAEADLNECLIDGLSSVLCRLTAAERRKWVTVLVNHKAANQKLQTSLSFITLMTLSAMMEHSGLVGTEAAEEVVAVLLRNWKVVNGDKKSPKQKNVEATPLDLATAVKEFGSKRHLYSNFIQSVKENKGLPEGVFIGVMYRLISSLKISKQLAGKHWWAIHPEKKGDDLYLHVCTRIFDMLTTALASDQQENMKCYESLLQLLFKTQFDKLSLLFKFLAMLWTSNCLDMSITSLTTVTQARALRVACAALSSVDNKADMAALMGTKSPVIPSLLVSLTSVYPPVREAALMILGAVKEKCPADASPYMVVVSRLVHAKEELITDQHHLSQTLGVLFSKIKKAEDETGELLSPKKKEKSKAKKGLLQAALGSLLHCVVGQETPRHVVTGLLKCLKEVHSEDMLNQLLPVMQDILHRASTTQHHLSPNDATSLELILTKFNAETSALLARNDQSVKLFLKALQLDKVVCPGKLAPGEMAIKQVTKEFFSSIPSADVQQLILCALIDLWTDGSTVATATLVTKALKGLSLQAEQIALELNKLDQQAGAVSTVREAKRARRMSRPNVPSEEDTAPMERRGWRRVTLILEMLQNKKKVKNIHLLIPIFFGLISKLFEVDDTSSTEYVKQLLLSCILHACQKLSPDGKPIDESLVSEKQFNVELLVQCIRSSDNPQTHRHALLLLSMAAGLFPDHVLHNIMAVFTFMGANIMRQDDAYSFQVITKTLETVIPALIKASEQQEKVQHVVSDVLRVFVDASPHIPDHRRLPLFTKLAETVGTEKFLWIMVVQMLESHITKGAQKTDEQENKPPAGHVHQDIEFCLHVVHSFSPRVQVVCCHQLLQYLAKLPQDKEEDTATTSKTRTPRNVTKKKTKNKLFDTETHTAKQLRHFKYTLANVISVLLSSETFISQLVELEETDVTSMQPLYQTLLEEDLRYITQVAHCLEAHTHSNTAKFWRALLHKGYDILEKVNALLPGNVFVTVVTGLMQNELATVRRKAMDMLNNKLQQQQTPFTQEEQSALLNLIDKLVSVAAATNLTDSDGGEEQAVNRQTALYSLKLLCKCLGKDGPAAFTKLFVLSTTIFLESGASTASPVAASALLLLAELCSVLKAHAIPFLPRFMPGLLKVLQNEENLLSNDLLLLSAVTTLHKVVESLPHFLSPYLEEVLLRVVQLSCLESEDHHKSQLHLRLRAVRHNLSTVIAPRVLLPAVTHCYDSVVQQQKSCIIPLMSILEGHLSSMSKDDLNSHHNQIVTFFLTALDFRMNNQNLPMLDILKIEECVIKPVIAMIMRLSEATFRPMFFKLFDWATRLETTKDRLITFYRLGNCISEKLKGLFSLFAGHIVKNSANILNDNNTYKTAEPYFGEDPRAEEKASQLLQYVLDCLHKIFLYDTDGFLNKERFDTLMQPLADQLENLQGGEGCYESRVNDHLVPCIAQFAIAAGDDGMWKPLNYQVLLKTRNISAKVRFAALRVIEEFNTKLGEEYMTLLPETIPFLAELMEDESEEVEHKCQEVVTQMEKVLGEPIQKYF